MNAWYDNDLCRQAIKRMADLLKIEGCHEWELLWSCRVEGGAGSSLPMISPFLVFAFCYPSEKTTCDNPHVRNPDFFLITKMDMANARAHAEMNGGITAERIASALLGRFMPDEEDRWYAC